MEAAAAAMPWVEAAAMRWAAEVASGVVRSAAGIAADR